MSLVRKFLLLVGLIAASAVFNAWATAWSIQQLRSEMTEKLASVDQVLGGLNRLKRDVWRQATLLGATGAPTDTPAEPLNEELLDLRDDIVERSLKLEEHDDYLLRSGVRTASLLRDTIDESQRTVTSWLDTSDAEQYTAASSQLLALHELIERIETKLLEDTRLAVGFGKELNRAVLAVTATSGALVLLTIILAVILFRRWFTAPVRELRTATEHIAKGNFAYRVRDLGNDEMGRLASEINDMAGLVSAMQRDRVRRERFAAVGEMTQRIVHNLRNPLSGIRSLAEITRNDTAPDDQRWEHQRRIIESVDRFEEWLAGLLRATRPLEINAAVHDVSPLLQRVCDAHAPAAEAASVRIDREIDRSLAEQRFDPVHLEHALSALVSNAIQASPEGGSVRISAGAGQNGSWSICVEDEGAGIDDDVRSRIFEPWFTTKGDGTGIGLAMVRRITTEHGGSVNVEPRSGGPGTRFVIRLPK